MNNVKQTTLKVVAGMAVIGALIMMRGTIPELRRYFRIRAM
jgi:uncharacterized protein DUF6893